MTNCRPWRIPALVPTRKILKNIYSTSKKRNLGSERSIHKDCHWLPNLLTLRYYSSHLQLPTAMPSILFWVDSRRTFRVMEELRSSLVNPRGNPSHSTSVYLESSITLSLLSLAWCCLTASREYCWPLPISDLPSAMEKSSLASLLPSSFENHQTWILFFKKWGLDSLSLTVLLYHCHPNNDTSHLLFTSL